ncbi:hypothetical protein [Shewanella waksmanii]|uniref:hypothetical protein n=1 Tax=Shewanella waksmanii TaxID=213783 RepID=UPI003736BBEC
MNEYNAFLAQGYWWLSLLGGIHCIGLGLYIRYIYKEASNNHKLLGGIFSLMGLYFFTGMLSKDNSPVPMHIIYTLIIPIYFILMPTLYLYCYRSLHNITAKIRWSPHLYLPIIVTSIVALTALLDKHWVEDISIDAFSLQNLSYFTSVGMLLPALLSIQTLVYFVLIFKLLRRYKSRASRAHLGNLRDIKFRWLMVLTVALLSNWIVRTLLLILPFYFGDHIGQFSQAMTRLLLLATVYVLAIYGLQQVTKAAFLRGKLAPQSPQPKSPQRSTTQLLNSEELNYLQKLIQDEKKE